MPSKDDRTPGLANALFGPRLGRPVFVAARTSTPLPMSVTDPATNLSQGQFFSRPIFLKANFSQGQFFSRTGDLDGSGGLRPPGIGSAIRSKWQRGPPNCRGTGPRPPRYLILVSLKATCLRAIGSYFLKESFSVAVRGFFLVT